MKYHILNDITKISDVCNIGKLVSDDIYHNLFDKDITPDTDFVICSMLGYTIGTTEYNDKYIVFNYKDADEVKKEFEDKYCLEFVSAIYTEKFYNELLAIIKKNEEIDNDMGYWKHADDQYEDPSWWSYVDLTKYKNFNKNWDIKFCI